MRRFALAALVTGVVAGVLVAVLVPESRTAPAQPEPLKFAPERKPAGSQNAVIVYELVPGTDAIEMRRPDPAGGPEWALRTFDSEQTFVGGNRVRTGRLYCVQLGRIARGKFGWVDGSNTFRPVSFDSGAPIQCDGQAPRQERPMVVATTTTAQVTRPDAHLGTTIVWGMGGRAATGVTVDLAGRRARPRLSAHGGFIEFAGTHTARADLGATYEYGSEKSSATGSAGIGRGELIAVPGDGERKDYPVDPRPVAKVAVRTPDPGGGPPFGLGFVPSQKGKICLTGPGRVIDGRVGSVDADLGTFEDENAFAYWCRSLSNPRRKNGADFQVGPPSGSVTADRASDDDRSRLRTGRVRSFIWGLARDDVTSVTIATPRDVRTILPDRTTHAFLAAYDQDFASGEAVVTVNFADGSSREAGRERLRAIDIP